MMACEPTLRVEVHRPRDVAFLGMTLGQMAAARRFLLGAHDVCVCVCVCVVVCLGVTGLQWLNEMVSQSRTGWEGMASRSGRDRRRQTHRSL